MNNQQGKSNIIFLILGIVFLFIPFIRFLGVIFIIIYFSTLSSKSSNIEYEVRKEMEEEIDDIETELDKMKKEIKYKFENEPVTAEQEEMYEQMQQQIENNNIEVQDFSSVKGAIDKKGIANSNDGPIKYY